MRCLAKISALILGLLLSLPAHANALALSLTTPTDTAKDTTKNADLVSELISAAESNGMRVIVIENTTSQGTSGNSETPRTNAMELLPPGATSLMQIQTEVIAFRETLKGKLAQLPAAIAATEAALRKKSPSGTLRPYVRALYWSVLLLIFGALLERELYIKRIVRRWLEPDLKDNPKGYIEKIPVLIKRALLKVVGVIVSMVVAFFTGSMMFSDVPPESIQFTIAVIYIGYAACRLLSIIWRMILAPYLSRYRIPHIADKSARTLYHWLWLVSSINVIVIMISIWLGELGEESHITAVLTSVFGAVVAIANIIMVVANRKVLSSAICNGKKFIEANPVPRLLSRIWLPAAISYFVFSWLEMTYRVVLDKPISTPLIAGAYGILISILCVYGLINYFIERFFQREKRYVTLPPEETTSTSESTETPSTIETTDTGEAAEDAPTDTVINHQTLSTYEDLARRVASILSILAGLWALTKIWNVNNPLMQTSSFERGLDGIAILFFGYIIYHIVRIWIDNKIQEEGGDISLAPGDEGGATGASRLATLLPLFRNFMLVVISLSVIFSALLEMGINVSPLFASAGVVGLAIGFGAQTLVRDIFSGAFYLFDDAFRRGEYVDIGDVKGTVEKISVRSFQLRHHLGPLHTIPFGEIQFLTNYSRDWVMMKLPLRLTYDTDPEKVRKLIKKLGQRLMDDPIIGDTFLQPLKSQGVLEMVDSAMIVRVKFMAKPGDQWVIRKRVFQEIRDLFEREGIKFAHREVTVRLAGDTPQNLSEQQTRTVAAAALNDELEDEPPSSGDDR
ncbi:hypothetical protein AB833_21330 [Chromatiales bacterium (ex Bugula neritina AB1)]|nr:hypothetical protein AB833_21330 [Chromatiales bacterium (ex Bugula neritina AB1)]